MNPFDLSDIILSAAAIFIVTLAVSVQVTKNLAISIFAAFVKAGIFTIYFGLVFDGTYTFLDDWSYLEGGIELVRQDVGITNLTDNWEFALMIGNGEHFVYYLYNAYAFRIFGEGYFAPVALNVLLTIAIAYFGTKLAATEFVLNKSMSRVFFLFLLLHPDILAWSSIMNGKDILVLLLHVLLLTAISIYMRAQPIKALLIALPVTFTLFFLRFYVPVLFAMALVTGALLSKQRSRIIYLMFSVGFASLAFLWVGESGLQYAANSIQENFVNPIYGLVRFILTPIPFNTEEAYAFLNIPALAHWILIPFVALGLWGLWSMKSPFSRFFIFYLLFFVALYAVYGELQGPRHRVQLDYAWAVLQFMGIITALRILRSDQKVSLALHTE